MACQRTLPSAEWVRREEELVGFHTLYWRAWSMFGRIGLLGAAVALLAAAVGPAQAGENFRLAVHLGTQPQAFGSDLQRLDLKGDDADTTLVRGWRHWGGGYRNYYGGYRGYYRGYRGYYGGYPGYYGGYRSFYYPRYYSNPGYYYG